MNAFSVLILVILVLSAVLLVAILVKVFGKSSTVVMPSGVNYKIEGELKRQRENTQFYVIDPADKTFTWINSTDDMYEDADGKIWRLV